jgi:hypothetical protein
LLDSAEQFGRDWHEKARKSVAPRREGSLCDCPDG